MMQMQSLHEDTGALSARALPPPDTPETRPGDISKLLNEWHDIAALEITLELIEMRYQLHHTHMDLQALFAEGGLCCLWLTRRAFDPVVVWGHAA
jgi:hypothetical protein